MRNDRKELLILILLSVGAAFVVFSGVYMLLTMDEKPDVEFIVPEPQTDSRYDVEFLIEDTSCTIAENILKCEVETELVERTEEGEVHLVPSKGALIKIDKTTSIPTYIVEWI